MRGIVVVALSSLAIVGCNSCATKGKINSVAPAPDTSRMIRVVGRWSTASACPIGPRLALTAAHVVDPRPFDNNVGYSPMAFQQGDVIGTFNVATIPKPTPKNPDAVEYLVSRSRDLAYVNSNVALKGWYPRAEKAPAPGEYVYFYGLDWRSKSAAFAERVFRAKVIRSVAGILVYEPAGEPGTSGSCVLNEKAEVVAVNTGGVYVGNSRSLGGLLLPGDEVGIGVGVWESLGSEGN